MTFRGYLDSVRRGWVEGWAWDSDRPNEPLTILVSLDGIEVARGPASIQRPDLADAGLGAGYCAFSIRWDDSETSTGNHKLTARIEGRDVDLEGSPAAYNVAGGINLLEGAPHGLDEQGRPDLVRLTEDEFARVAFEVVGGAIPTLRIWLLHPAAVPTQTKGVESAPSPPDVPLLRYTMSAPNAADVGPMVVGLDIRAASAALPITLCVRGLAGGVVVFEQRFTASANNAWDTLAFEIAPPGADAAPDTWLYELATTCTTVMAGVELRNLVLGSPKPALGVASVGTPKPVSYYEPERGAFAESNLLSTCDMLAPGPDGKLALAGNWTTIRGRDGELVLSPSPHPWLPTGDRRHQPRRLAHFKIESNIHYFRFVHQLRGATVARSKRLGAELVFGADAAAGTSAGLMLATFLRVLNANGVEVILPLIPKQEVTDTLVARSASQVITDERATLLRECKSVQYVIEITGTGNLLLGLCWLGDADLPAAKAERVSAVADLRGREWHYQRFVETTETLFLAAGPRADIIACVRSPGGLSVDQRNQLVAFTVRSLVKHTSMILVILDAPADSGPAVVAAAKQALGNAVSLREMAQVTIKFAPDEAAAARLFAALTDTISPTSLVVAFPAGSAVRSDFSQALGSVPTGAEAPDFIVFDHDFLAGTARRSAPVLKPGLSSHLLLEKDYIGPGVAFRATPLQRALGDGAISPLSPFGTRDVVLRLFDVGMVGAKLDCVLVHFPLGIEGESRADERTFIESVLARRGTPATLSRWGSEYTVKYETDSRPLVSIIVLFRDKVDFLRRCVESIVTRSEYTHYEIILVNNQSSEPSTAVYLETLQNDSRIKIVDFDRSFNYSAANNFGVRHAVGEYLLFLNNDTEVLSGDWLDVMMGLAAQKDTGFVGARLHLETGVVQHAGIVVGLCGMAGHVFAGEHDVAMPRAFLLHTRDVSAVTGAAMCIKAGRYLDLGGFDERFILTGNDVEICLRARRRGWRNVYAGSVQLFHFEKTSRKEIPTYLRDIQLSLEAYEPDLSLGDPYWNAMLSRTRPDYLPRAPVEPTPGDIRKAAVERRTWAMKARKLGPDANYIAFNDIDRASIEANRALNRDYARGGAGRIRRAAYFVPNLTHIYRGGLFTCFRLAAALYRNEGVEPLVVICGERSPNLDLLARQFEEAFPGIPFQFHHFNPLRDSPVSIPRAEIAVATLWTTAFVVARYPAKGKFYLIQDYEPLFESTGAGYGLIEATYRFGFFHICNSPGVAAAVAPYSDAPTLSFEPAVDRDVFYPSATLPPPGAPVRIVFYGRPNSPRNLFGMGMHALLEVKSILRDSVEIISVGAEFDPADHGAAGKILNVGLLPSIASVAALYRSSDIGLVFMQSKHPSYQPLEYMASGCATVTNVNESNTWLLKHRQNCILSQITLSDVVESLVNLVEDVALRTTIRERGLQTVAGTNWAPVEAAVTQFMMRPVALPVARSRVRKDAQ